VLINEQPLEWRSLCPGLRERERESSEEEDRWINLLKIYIRVERAQENVSKLYYFDGGLAAAAELLGASDLHSCALSPPLLINHR
jgi:hypothetical protein